MKKHLHFIIFSVSVLIFILFQLQFLNRPYYWDEAWSYASALYAMVESGPSLLPGAIHEYLYRGHPLFFYFITSIWMKVVGGSLVAVHSFFLIVSTLLLTSTFLVGKKIFNRTVGLFAALFLMVTSAFITQASFLLPEVMLALLTLLCIYFYLQKKIFLEILFGTLLILTKETGIVLIGSILLYDLIVKVKVSKGFKALIGNILSVSWHAIPFFFGAIFFLLQKIKMGWFFYPEHLSMLTYNISEVIANLVYISRYIFQLQGRIIITIISIFSLIYLLYNRKISKRETSFLLLSVLFMVGYILFSAIIFFTLRYVISVLPVLYLMSSFLIYKLFEERVYISGLIVGLFLLISISYSIKSDSLGDTSIGFISMVNVHKNAVVYCEKSSYHDLKISTHFLMIYNLKSPFLGYLQNDKQFKHVENFDSSSDGDIIIVSTIELSSAYEVLKKNPDYILQKRFEEKKAWCEIYKKVSSD